MRRHDFTGPSGKPSVGGQRSAGRGHPVIPLQRAIGNRATRQLLREAKVSPAAPPKAKVTRSFTVKIKGEDQGEFRGDDKGQIKGRKYEFSVNSPTAASTGEARGKRQYQAIRFYKDLDAASPQLMQALTSNENLPEVTFEFSEPAESGEGTRVFQVVKLTNARITGFTQNLDEEGDGEEKVELVFDKIAMENQPGKTSTADDWRRP